MSKVAIKVEDVSKQYRLGNVGTGTLGHDLNRWWHRLRGNEDPYLKIGEANDRTIKGNSEYVWALQDINFDVKQGDVLGIIGRNGAGKSTLLKILSRTTAPTTGNVKIKGRIASLLEVGTGFHPELTGGENIYLNGAILGMTKKEIKSKFDEIVDFAGVERYVDTPVKRYSSGMYVRLAFGVAAHLESEILIVDEVLAVGDAEFQKKCLGKMQEVSSGQGRTVLFVSHNMNAVKHLCKTGIVMKNGGILYQGESGTVIEEYLKTTVSIEDKTAEVFFEEVQDKVAQIRHASLKNDEGKITSFFDIYDKKFLEIEYDIRTRKGGLSFTLMVTKDDQMIFRSADTDIDESMLDSREMGSYKTKLQLPSFLKAGIYFISLGIGLAKVERIDFLDSVLCFEVTEDSIDTTYKSFSASRPGVVKAEIEWVTHKIS